MQRSTKYSPKTSPQKNESITPHSSSELESLKSIKSSQQNSARSCASAALFSRGAIRASRTRQNSPTMARGRRSRSRSPLDQAPLSSGCALSGGCCAQAPNTKRNSGTACVRPARCRTKSPNGPNSQTRSRPPSAPARF